jgi:hypothetical protein
VHIAIVYEVHQQATHDQGSQQSFAKKFKYTSHHHLFSPSRLFDYRKTSWSAQWFALAAGERAGIWLESKKSPKLEK